MQQPLPFQIDSKASFQNFYSANDYTKELIRHLQANIQTIPSCTVLIGNKGCGKSHLLKSSCLYTPYTWSYIPCKELSKLHPDILCNPDNHLLCLDDIEFLVGNSMWEKALFQYLTTSPNRSILLSAQQSLLKSQTLIPDLHSRISAMETFDMPDLDEYGQIQALKKRAISRGITLTDTLISWIFKNQPRDNHSLFKILYQLDHHCLQHQKKPSIHTLMALEKTNPSHRHD